MAVMQIFVNAGQSDLFCLPHPVQASRCGYIITCQTNTDYQTDSWNCFPESNAKALHHLSLPDWRILEEDTRAKVLRLPLGDTHWKYRPFWRLSSSANAYRHQGSQQRRKKQKQNSTQCKRNITISAGVLWTFRKEITTKIQDQNTTAIKTQWWRRGHCCKNVSQDPTGLSSNSSKQSIVQPPLF